MARVNLDGGGDIQPRARALGDPSRYRIFGYLCEAERPVDIAELTQFMHLNHNAVRQHLAVLCTVGLVIEETEKRRRPGRPRLLYRTAPEVAGTWGTSGPIEVLAGLLVEVIDAQSSPREVGRRAGSERVSNRKGQVGSDGRDPVADGANANAVTPLEEMGGQLAALGFQPNLQHRGDGAEILLTRCPYASIATRSHRPICELHLGIAEGLAEAIGGIAVISLVARDPSEAGCALRMVEIDSSTTPGGSPSPAQAGDIPRLSYLQSQSPTPKPEA